MKKSKLKQLIREVIAENGLWDYSTKEAAEEIWAVMKSKMQSMVTQAKRSGITYRLSPLRIIDLGSKKLGFEPSTKEKKELAILVKKEIDKSIADHTLNLNNNVKYSK